MTDRNDEPAFPVPARSGSSIGYRGMTLRDWFAGQYLAGLAARPDIPIDRSVVAEACYSHADAMLEARK